MDGNPKRDSLPRPRHHGSALRCPKQGRGAVQHFPPSCTALIGGRGASPSIGLAEAQCAAHQMTASVEEASWQWLEAQGPGMGGGQGGSPSQIRGRMLCAQPHPHEAVCVGPRCPTADSRWEDNKTAWLCQQRRTWWRGEREKSQSDGSPPAPENQAAACRLFPSPAAGRGLCTNSGSRMLS